MISYTYHLWQFIEKVSLISRIGKFIAMKLVMKLVVKLVMKLVMKLIIK